ncbi:MAG: hypothetical protein KAJ48_05300, partial [Elusimicrobiales bacterium]|nr:hypothetical protein [Elusimicrobiales bacterium]
TTPASDGVILKEITTISGASADAISAADKVELQIQRLSDDYYWDDSAFVNDPSTWVAAADLNPWTYTGFEGSLTSGTTYTIRARVYDTAGNLSSSVEKDITYDNTGPVSELTFPNDNVCLSSLSLEDIAGTAKDYPGSGGLAAGLYKVEGIVERVIPAGWWTGVDWKTVKPSTWPVATLLGGDPITWDVSMAPVGELSDNAEYKVHTRARDNAVDITETAGTGNLGSEYVHTFYFDDSNPRSKITNVADGNHKNSLAVISGTADDNVSAYATRRVNAVKVHIYDVSNETTYNGNADPSLWDDDDLLDGAHWFDANYVGESSGVWTFNSPNWEHMSEYRLVSKAVDRAANYEISLTTINFTYDIYQADPEKPDSAVVVPDNDQHFNNKFTTISGTSLDNTRGLITEVRLKIRRLPNSDLGESTTYYWDNTAKDWDTDVKSSSANATDEDYNSNYEDWHWDTPQSGLEAISFWKLARKYEVASIVFDKASNIELLLSTNTYVYELDIPTTTITYPVTDGYFSQTGKITGIVQDSIPGKVENVYVRIEQLSGPHIG